MSTDRRTAKSAQTEPAPRLEQSALTSARKGEGEGTPTKTDGEKEEGNTLSRNRRHNSERAIVALHSEQLL